MIRNDAEYAEALKRIREGQARLLQQQAAFEGRGYSTAEVERLMAPLHSFHLQGEAEVDTYLRWKAGDFSGLGLESLSLLPIAGRIARGMNQRELALKLDSHESAISRQEKNEYHGIAFERLMGILHVLGIELGPDGEFRLRPISEHTSEMCQDLPPEFVEQAQMVEVVFEPTSCDNDPGIPPGHPSKPYRLAA